LFCIYVSEKLYRILQKDNPATKVHSYRASTATGPLRSHLRKHHAEEWVKECQKLGIKLRGKEGEEAVAMVTGQPLERQAEARTPYTQDNFLDALVQFIVATDQVFIFFYYFFGVFPHLINFLGHKDCRQRGVSQLVFPAPP
jgi:hypothetical protein